MATCDMDSRVLLSVTALPVWASRLQFIESSGSFLLPWSLRAGHRALPWPRPGPYWVFICPVVASVSFGEGFSFPP